MKTLFLKSVRFALLPMLFGGFLALTSCSNDDPDPVPISDAFSTNFEYKAQVSADLLLVADVVAVYQDEQGQQKSEPVTSTMWTKTFKAESLPCTTGVIFNITKKPGFDQAAEGSRKYLISGALDWSIIVKQKQNGSVVFLKQDSEVFSETVTADMLDLALAEMNGSEVGLVVSLGSDNKPMYKETSIDWKYLDYIPKFSINTTLSPDLLEIADVKCVIVRFSREFDMQLDRIPIAKPAWSHSSEGISLPEVTGFTFEFTRKATISPEKTKFVIKAGADVVVAVKGKNGDFVTLPGVPQPQGIDVTISAAEIDNMIAQLNGGSWVYQVTPDKSLNVVVNKLDIDFEKLAASRK